MSIAMLFSMPFAAAEDLVKLAILLFVLMIPVLKKVIEYFAQQNSQKKQPALQRENVANAPDERNTFAAVAAPVRPSSYHRSVESEPEQRRTPVRNRSKSKNMERLTVPVAQPAEVPLGPSGATSVPPPTASVAARSLAESPHPAAQEILKMFQNPASMQQAVLISEILRRPYE